MNASVNQLDPDRAKRALEMLLSYGEIFVFVDRTKPGVAIPDCAIGQRVTLKLSHMYGEEYPLLIGEHGFTARLDFNGEKHTCQVPYSAILGFAEPIGRLEKRASEHGVSVQDELAMLFRGVN